MNRRSRHEAPPARDAGAGEVRRRWTAAARAVPVFLVYLAGFLALDFATEGIKGSLHVSLWFPPAGLTFALLLVFGWRYAAAVIPVFFLHLVLFRGGLGYPLALLLAIPVLYAALYAGAAALLLRVVKVDPRLPRMRDVAWFVGVACLLAPALVAALVVSGLVAGGYASVGAFWGNLLGFWAGDATGIAVLTPLLLIALRPFPSLWAEVPGRAFGPAVAADEAANDAAGFRLPPRREMPEALLQILVLALALTVAYVAARGASLDYAYLVFAPIVWVALRGGLERAVLALFLANVGVVILVGEAAGGPDPTLLQFGLMALTLVGLFLGGQRSEQERAEGALRRSERRFRSMVRNSSEVSEICDPDGTLRYASPAHRRVFGYDPEAAVGTNVLDRVHPDDLPRVLEETERAMKEGTGNDGSVAEYRFRHADGSWRWAESVGTYLVDDPAVGGVVINVRDVTERKEAEKALEESEERYRRRAWELSLLHRIRSVLARELDPSAMCRAVVEEVAETYGYVLVSAYLLEGGAERGTLALQHQVGYETVLERIPVSEGVMGRVARTSRPVLLEDARAEPEFLGAIQGIVSEACVPLFDGDEVIGTLNVESTEGMALAEDDLRLLEAVGGHVGVALGRARLYARVREAEERYRALVENVPAVVYIDDADETNSAIYRSPHVREVLGYEPEEFLSDPEFWQRILHPEDRERVLTENDRTNQTGEPFRIEYRMIRKDGRSVWLRDEAVLIRDEDGRPRFWQGYFADITDRKAVEGALREAETRYRTLVEQSPAATYVQQTHHGYTIVYVSPQIERMTGRAPEDYYADADLWYAVVHPEDRGRVAAEDDRTDRTREPFSMEYRLVHHDGRTVWVRDEATLLEGDDGRPEYWHGVMFDITDRKEAEEKLKGSEERFRALVQNASDMISILNPDGTIRYISPSVERVLGYEPEERIGVDAFGDDTHPDDTERVLGAFARGLGRPGGVSEPLEFRVRHKDGAWRRLEAVAANRLDHPAVRGIVVNARDVTERKRAEEELQRERNLLRTVIDSAQDAIFVKDTEHRFVLNNRAHQQILGVEGQEDLLGKTNADYWGEEGAAPHHADDRRVIDAGERIVGKEEQIDYAGFGERRWISTTKVPLRGPDDSVEGLVAVSRDITDKRRAEMALRESEAWLRQLMEQAADAIIVHDLQGRVTDVNRQACETLGYTRAELLGMSVADIEMNFASGNVRDQWERLVPGRSVTVDGVHRRKDGTEFPVEVRVGLLEGGGERLLLAICRDVTERRRVEEALRESEERHRAVMEQSTEAIWLFDPDSKRVLESNAAFRELLGYSEEELRGMTNYDFVAHSREDIDATVARKVREGKYGVADERRYRRKDGAILDVEVRGTAISYRGGEMACSVARDVTERKKAEEALRRSEDRFRQLFEQSADAILLHDEQGRMVDCNEEARRSLGYSREELLDMTLRDFVAEGLLTEEERGARGSDTSWRRAAAGEPGEIVGHHRGRHRRKDGTTFPVEVAVGSIEYGGRKLILASARDVTARERAEEALKESEQRYRSVIERTSEGVFLARFDTECVVESNAALQKMLGYSSEELDGMSIYDFIVDDPREINSNTQAIRSGSLFLGRRVYRRGDGGLIDVETSATHIPYGDGEVSCVIVHDVTERKRAEEEMKEANRRLGDLAVLKADFTAMVAHELDTPLAVIRGYADVLAAGDLGPEVEERALARIQSETEVLDSLVADVRSASSAERSDFDVELRPVPLGDLLSDAAAFADTLPGDHPLVLEDADGVGRGEGVRAGYADSIAFEDAAAGQEVWADRYRIGQVLRNLLTNAVKHSPEGTPIELRTVSGESSGRVRIEVVDQGPGIHPDDAERIFEKFGRGHGASGRKAGGLGLGLYLSRRIVRAHGSELTVDGGPHGAGSVFGFDLEAADE